MNLELLYKAREREIKARKVARFKAGKELAEML